MWDREMKTAGTVRRAHPRPVQMEPAPARAAVSPGVQRKAACACGGSCPRCRGASPAPELDSADTVPAGVGQVVAEGGRPLDSSVRGDFGQRMGHDFGDVRIHDDARAAASAEAMNAAAYTVGHRVVFGTGRYAPDTQEGRRLLAHELTHVVQQRGQTGLSPSRWTLGNSDDPLEHEADRVADAVVSQPAAARGPISASPAAAIRRDDKGKAPPPPPWTTDDLKKMLDSCDGGLGIWGKAKKANKDKDPQIVAGAGGQVELEKGLITLDRTLSKCDATQQLIQELSNLSRKADFNTLDTSAMAGDVTRADYIKRTEKIEYESGVQNVLTAFDACKGKWGCATSPKEWAREAKDFDDYFKRLLSEGHKEFYGKWWDDNCKAAYDKKHAKK